MKYIIEGGHKLKGQLKVYSAKNCLLVLLACSVLTEQTMVFKNCKRIADVDVMIEILREMGVAVTFEGDDILVNASGLNTSQIPEGLSGKMRGSIFLLGALLGRLKRATAFTPGGCAIGKRPIDIHIEGLKTLGVEIEEVGNRIICNGENSCGSTVHFRFASVGATENLLMFAVLTRGTTVIHNCACEPEVEALARCLVKMGANIQGIGQSTLTVTGVDKLHGVEFEPITDRIVAGTYLVAAAVAGGDVMVSNCNPCHIGALLDALRSSGCELFLSQNSVRLVQTKRLKPFDIQTAIYPGFPTDMQSLILTAATIANGKSKIAERVFENRLHANCIELNRMGADIAVLEDTAYINGVERLHSAEVACCDLRGGAGLVLAALAAEGTTTLCEIHHIQRGYSQLDQSLNSIGAKVRLI